MDEIDRANDHAMNLTEDALASVRGLVPQEKDELTDDDLECEICGEPNSIPPARAMRGYTSCVSCQSLVEARSKQYGRKSNRYDYDD